MTRYLNIEAKHRPNGANISSIKDFTVTDGGTVDSNIIIANHNLSLYCFDDGAKEAIFVELSPNIDLTTVPFVYTTQYEEAKRLVAVPYESFRKIASTLPPVDHLIMTYISGRSGSTLLSHVFNEVDGVMSLSEPDVITQFVHMREDDGTRDAELRGLMDSTVRILFKPNPFKDPNIYALKYRMETLRVMDLFQDVFPHARNLYLYRDAIGFVASFYRIFKSMGADEYLPLEDFLEDFNTSLKHDFMPLVRAYLAPDLDRISMIQGMTLFWMVGIEWYFEQASKGIPILAVRYADFQQTREKVLTAIFEHCGLPVIRASQPFKAFERDSQAGSILERASPNQGNPLQLTDEQEQEIRQILAKHPDIDRSDLIVPNTLEL